MRRLFILSISLLLALEMHAYVNFIIDNLNYGTFGDGTAVILWEYANIKPVGQLEIPDSVMYSGKSYPVTAIGDGSFHNCTDLTSIIIPKGVDYIGQYAFYECSNLTSITLPECIPSIEESVFEGCSNLVSVMLPSSIKTIKYGAFYKCTGLSSITIPEGVTSIGDDCFASCTHLTSLMLPSSVTSIRDAAFGGCSGLQEIYVSNPTLPTVGRDVFKGVDKSTCKLYVPIGSKDAYVVADEWKDFKNIEEIDMTSASESEEVPLMISTEGNGITIIGAESGATITVYTVTGTMLLTLPATGEEQRIALPSGGLYFVKVGSQTMKVVL